MYLDDSIIARRGQHRRAIARPRSSPDGRRASQLTMSPQILMWDPESHPGATRSRRWPPTGAPVVDLRRRVPPLLESQGIIKTAQIDPSYEGTPARFVSDPRILQQGFATAEPYIYEHEIAQWKKPVAYQLLADLGYSIYPEPLAVRADKLEELRPCLEKLVPIMQQAQIDYLEDPAPTNELIVELVDAVPDRLDLLARRGRLLREGAGRGIRHERPGLGGVRPVRPGAHDRDRDDLRADPAVGGQLDRTAPGREPLHQRVHRRHDHDVSTATETACAEIARLGAGSRLRRGGAHEGLLRLVAHVADPAGEGARGALPGRRRRAPPHRRRRRRPCCGSPTSTTSR